MIGIRMLEQHRFAAIGGIAALALAWLPGEIARSASVGSDPFEIIEISSSGRTLAAEIGDFDGDGRDDLLQFISIGIPPDQTRTLRLYLQSDTGIAVHPSFQMPIPRGAAAYDIADVLDAPGIEILLLRSDGIAVLSLASVPRKTPQLLNLSLPAAISLGAGEDERGLDRIQIAIAEFGDEPWLMAPGFGELFLLGPDGGLRAKLDAGGRANYFIQPPGPVFAESDIQLYFDAPRISLGDIDGDGDTDILSSTRHELRVFLRRTDGGFGYAPDRRIPLRRVSQSDHIRGSGAVRSIARDLDGDGRLDLLVSETRGGITDASAVSSIYLNRDGDWDLSSPDAVYSSQQAVSTDQLIDLNSDGKTELIHFVIPINVLELVEIFVTRAIDVHLSIYATNGQRSYSDRPVYERKLDVPLDFETSRPKGFVPTFNFDLDGDGRRDYLASGDGDEIEVSLGYGEFKFGKRVVRQALATEGALCGGDLNGDGLTDVVVFNPRRPDQPLFVAINRGSLARSN